MLNVNDCLRPGRWWQRLLVVCGCAFLTSTTLGAQSETTASAEVQPVAVGQTVRLSMSDALRFALSRNPSMKIADMEVKKMNFEQRKAWSSLFPQISLQGNYSYTLKKQKMYFDLGKKSPMGGGGFPSDGFEVGQNHNLQGSLHMAMPIVAPQLWASLAVSRESVALAKEKSRASEIDLVAEVRKAYLGALLAKDSKIVFQRTFDQAKANYELIKQKYEKGLVAEYDVLRMKVQMENIRPNLMQADEALHLAKAQLKVLLDMDPDQAIELTGSLEEFASYVQSVAGSKLTADSINCSIEENSSIKQLAIQRNQIRQSEKIKKMAFLPTLSANYLYQHSFMSDEFNLSNKRRWSPYSMIGFSLNIPLFTGGKSYYDHKSAKVELMQMDLRKHQAEEQVRLGLINAESQMQKAAARYEAAQQSVRSAEKGMQIAEKRYMTGQGTLLEMNDADVSRLQAWLNYSQSIYDVMLAKYSIEQLQGKTIKDL